MITMKQTPTSKTGGGLYFFYALSLVLSHPTLPIPQFSHILSLSILMN
ncbi:hypothetical protein VCRA2113O213_80102 [Vibrio crassostreae]|nr:hypothetical protein VCRA2113O213_80102 [Vibrio crassostreae]